MLGHWVDHLIDQASDGPSDILIERKSVGCWLGLRALKTLYFYFCKVIKNLIERIFANNFARNYEKNNTWNIAGQ